MGREGADHRRGTLLGLRQSLIIRLLCAVDEQRTDGAEFGELLRIAEPAAVIFLRIRSRIGNALVRHVFESGGAKESSPLFSGEQFRGNRQDFAPLMAMRIVAVIIDQNPG